MSDRNSLCGKNVIITGASSGIGRTCALECARSGAIVHAIARSRDKLEDLLSQLTGSGHSIHCHDVTQYTEFSSIVEGIVKQTGRISGFIHSAGKQLTKPLKSTRIEDYIELFHINTYSAFLMTAELSKKKFMSEDGLSIVLISSIMSVVASSSLVAYCASKSALAGGARAMAIELAPKNIRVNCVSPGYMSDTPMMIELDMYLSKNEQDELKKGYPLGLGVSTDVAQLCCFLLSDKSKWITGQNYIIDGGFTSK